MTPSQGYQPDSLQEGGAAATVESTIAATGVWEQLQVLVLISTGDTMWIAGAAREVVHTRVKGYTAPFGSLSLADCANVVAYFSWWAAMVAVHPRVRWLNTPSGMLSHVACTHAVALAAGTATEMLPSQFYHPNSF